MSFTTLFLIFIIIFISLAIVLSAVLNKLGTRRFRISFVLSHSLLILIVAILVFLSRDDGQAGFYWLFPIYIDMPISILIILLRKIFPELIRPNSIIPPFIVFVVLGGLQYYFLGWILDFLYNLARRKLKPTETIK